MSLIREAELPGLGKKYRLTLANGEELVVIIRDDVTRELHYFGKDDDEPCSSVSLSDQESRQLGS